MIRCMDYNDIYWKQDPSHPSDIWEPRLPAEQSLFESKNIYFFNVVESA